MPTLAGTITEDGAPVIRTLYAIKSADGALLGTTTSGADGVYSFTLAGLDPVIVLALGGVGVRPLAHGPITPAE